MTTFKKISANKSSLSRRKPLLGIGINDAEYVVKPVVSGVRLCCPYYSRWERMIIRCYSPKVHSKSPTYKNCTVCDEWLTFSNFKAWMIKQDWEGKHLDKDIINPDNKTYSPSNCSFVDRHVNNLLLDSGASRGDFPQGVYLHSQCRMFAASLQHMGKTISLGLFKSQTDASNAYIKKKVGIILSVADGQCDERVRKGLRLHASILKSKLVTCTT